MASTLARGVVFVADWRHEPRIQYTYSTEGFVLFSPHGDDQLFIDAVSAAALAGEHREAHLLAVTYERERPSLHIRTWPATAPTNIQPRAGDIVKLRLAPNGEIRIERIMNSWITDNS